MSWRPWMITDGSRGGGPTSTDDPLDRCCPATPGQRRSSSLSDPARGIDLLGEGARSSNPSASSSVRAVIPAAPTSPDWPVVSRETAPPSGAMPLRTHHNEGRPKPVGFPARPTSGQRRTQIRPASLSSRSNQTRRLRPPVRTRPDRDLAATEGVAGCQLIAMLSIAGRRQRRPTETRRDGTRRDGPSAAPIVGHRLRLRFRGRDPWTGQSQGEVRGGSDTS